MQIIGENCSRKFFITVIPPVELCFIIYYAPFLTNLYQIHQYNLYTYTQGCRWVGGCGGLANGVAAPGTRFQEATKWAAK